MQPTPVTRTFTQKGILQFICKILGVLFVLQALLSAQKIISVEWTLNNWSQGNLALGVELISNAVISWVLLTKSDWISETLAIGPDEVRVAIGKQELLELVIIVAGLVLVTSSASMIFDSLVQYVYTSSQGSNMPGGIFSGLFMLAVGVLLLKQHKKVFAWISNLRETDHSE